MQATTPSVNKDNLSQQQLPFYPPNEGELRYDPELSTFKSDPISIEKQCKFCCVCDFPIIVRIVLIPCKHFLCYECYLIKGSSYCKICNEAISQFHRLSDSAKFYSCDMDTCSRYFENEQEFNIHIKMHDEINELKSR